MSEGHLHVNGVHLGTVQGFTFTPSPLEDVREVGAVGDPGPILSGGAGCRREITVSGFDYTPPRITLDPGWIYLNGQPIRKLYGMSWDGVNTVRFYTAPRRLWKKRRTRSMRGK